MPKDNPTEKTAAEILAEAGAMMKSMDAPAADPMQKGARAIREIDEDAQRLWKVKAPKGVNGEVAAYLVDDKTVLIHQRPSGKFAVFKLVALADLKPADGE